MQEKQSGSNTQTSAYSVAFYEAYGHEGAEIDTEMVAKLQSGTTPPPIQDPVGFGGQYGYYTDRETGLVLMGHRYYDPGTGRFLTRDPMGYGGIVVRPLLHACAEFTDLLPPSPRRILPHLRVYFLQRRPIRLARPRTLRFSARKPVVQIPDGLQSGFPKTTLPCFQLTKQPETVIIQGSVPER